uniref:Chromosome partition protein Smc n=1 Tax=Mesoaciditoga lauensis TaxID=1495039 RepID=A0A7V3REC9_9BACT
MKFSKLEINGFKSFGAPVSIDIKEGIVSIVGPNGSGKSNIVDAVRWLFGEKANSKLRMSETSDVLYMGSTFIKKAERATVKATFLNDGKEIKIEKIYSADGKNLYLLNGSAARLKDIEEIFSGSGTGKDFYSIVGQGEISNLVNSSPAQIKALIEEAAGVSIYKERKNEARSKLEDVIENLDKIKTVMDEIEHTMRSLNLKSKRAQKYKEYEQEIGTRKIKYFGHIYSVNSEKLEKVNKDVEEKGSKIADLQKALMNLEIESSQLKESSENAEEEIKKFEEEMNSYRQRERTLSDLKDAQSSTLSKMRSTYVELGTKKDGIKAELERHKVRSEELKRLMESLREEDEKLSNELKNFSTLYDQMTEAAGKEQKKRAQSESRISQLTKERNAREVERAKAFENVKDLNQRLSFIEAQIEEKKGAAQKIQVDLEKLELEESKSLDALENKNKRLNDIEEERKSIDEEITNLKKSRDSTSNKLMEIKSRYEILSRNLDNYSGYSGAVRKIITSQITGVIDVVANLLDVPRDIEMAVSVLLGGRMQNIAVKNSDVAKTCVELLKKSGEGRATFIPLDMVDLREPSVQSSIISARGVVGYAFKLVRSAKGYEGLVNFLFGTDLIVESLDDAIVLKKSKDLRSRIVSLDGQLISTIGTITGGSAERTDLISQRRILKDLSSEILSTSQKVKEIDEQITLIENRRIDILRERNEIEKGLLKENIALNNSRGSKNSILSSLASLQKEVNEIEKMKNEYLSRIQKDEKTIGQSEEYIRKIDSELSDLEFSMKSDSTEDIKRRQEMEKLQEEMIDLKMKLNSVKERFSGYSNENSRISKRIEELSSESSSIDANLNILISDINQSEERLKTVEKDLQSVRTDVEMLFERSKVTKGGRDEVLGKIEEIERSYKENKDQIDSLREETHALEIEKISYESSVLTAIEELNKVGGNKEESTKLDAQTFETLSSEIEEYERKMKFLGPVDLSAIDEYAETEKRFKEIDEQKKDLENSYRSLSDFIKRTDDEARIRLTQTMESVNGNFEKMISVLFSEGSGSLSFTEGMDILDAPVEINVKLPGKKLQKLYMMSGGEKSIVGIAFIFSLLMINPSAFYILDEADAALDEFSTQRFINLLEEYSKRSTFIVMTHNKMVMEKADMLYGITMIDGVSTVIPVEMSEFSESKMEG